MGADRRSAREMRFARHTFWCSIVLGEYPGWFSQTTAFPRQTNNPFFSSCLVFGGLLELLSLIFSLKLLIFSPLLIVKSLSVFRRFSDLLIGLRSMFLNKRWWPMIFWLNYVLGLSGMAEWCFDIFTSQLLNTVQIIEFLPRCLSAVTPLNILAILTPPSRRYVIAATRR